MGQARIENNLFIYICPTYPTFWVWCRPWLTQLHCIVPTILDILYEEVGTAADCWMGLWISRPTEGDSNKYAASITSTDVSLIHSFRSIPIHRTDIQYIVRRLSAIPAHRMYLVSPSDTRVNKYVSVTQAAAYTNRYLIALRHRLLIELIYYRERFVV